jgi:hypothetical protein
MPKRKEQTQKNFCNACKIEGVVICMATMSKDSQCNKGALTLEEARERNRKRDAMWQNYIEEVHGKKYRFPY